MDRDRGSSDLLEEKRRAGLFDSARVPRPEKLMCVILTAALETSTQTSQCLKIDSGAFSMYRAVVRMMKDAAFWAASTDWE